MTRVARATCMLCRWATSQHGASLTPPHACAPPPPQVHRLRRLLLLHTRWQQPRRLAPAAPVGGAATAAADAVLRAALPCMAFRPHLPGVRLCFAAGVAAGAQQQAAQGRGQQGPRRAGTPVTGTVSSCGRLDTCAAAVARVHTHASDAQHFPGAVQPIFAQPSPCSRPSLHHLPLPITAPVW